MDSLALCAAASWKQRWSYHAEILGPLQVVTRIARTPGGAANLRVFRICKSKTLKPEAVPMDQGGEGAMIGGGEGGGGKETNRRRSQNPRWGR